MVSPRRTTDGVTLVVDIKSWPASFRATTPSHWQKRQTQGRTQTRPKPHHRLSRWQKRQTRGQTRTRTRMRPMRWQTARTRTRMRPMRWQTARIQCHQTQTLSPRHRQKNRFLPRRKGWSQRTKPGRIPRRDPAHPNQPSSCPRRPDASSSPGCSTRGWRWRRPNRQSCRPQTTRRPHRWPSCRSGCHRQSRACSRKRIVTELTRAGFRHHSRSRDHRTCPSSCRRSRRKDTCNTRLWSIKYKQSVRKKQGRLEYRQGRAIRYGITSYPPHCHFYRSILQSLRIARPPPHHPPQTAYRRQMRRRRRRAIATAMMAIRRAIPPPEERPNKPSPESSLPPLLSSPVDGSTVVVGASAVTRVKRKVDQILTNSNQNRTAGRQR